MTLGDFRRYSTRRTPPSASLGPKEGRLVWAEAIVDGHSWIADTDSVPIRATILLLREESLLKERTLLIRIFGGT